MSQINPYGLSSKDYAKLYGVWRNMNDRCYNENCDRYINYGGRGISVCQEWRENFHAFAPWALRNGWTPDLWIERVDVNGDYCPENCTFLSRKEQMRNKTSNIRITIDGETKCMTEWCEIFGCDFFKAWARYKARNITDPREVFYAGDLRDLKPSIIQLTLDGEVVAEYARITDAQNETGVNASVIRNVCKGKGKTGGGYRWCYGGDALSST